MPLAAAPGACAQGGGSGGEGLASGTTPSSAGCGAVRCPSLSPGPGPKQGLGGFLSELSSLGPLGSSRKFWGFSPMSFMPGAGGWGERGEKTRGKSGFTLPRPKKRDAGSQSTFNLLPVQLSGTTKAWPKVSPVTWAGSAGPTPEPPKRGWVLEMGRALPLPSRGCWGMAVGGFVLGPLPPCVARELERGKGEHLGLNRSSPQRILWAWSTLIALLQKPSQTIKLH